MYKPGKLVQNAFLDGLNRFYREDVLDAYWFNELHQVRKLTSKWMEDYNYK
ncbi:integrase core domain-containing protein [Mariniflexile sp. HMF6888]|uniref:integrase core domain-containing protein n=1 Tax=Mariniflexile sp. HMF6888 TaxID=3373086 RepID=UPI003798F872